MVERTQTKENITPIITLIHLAKGQGEDQGVTLEVAAEVKSGVEVNLWVEAVIEVGQEENQKISLSLNKIQIKKKKKAKTIPIGTHCWNKPSLNPLSSKYPNHPNLTIKITHRLAGKQSLLIEIDPAIVASMAENI
jgi:hypothetical protein